MRPTIVLPDAEVVAVEYLRPRLAEAWPTAEVGTLVPAHRPFVQLRRVGGSTEVPGADAPRIDVIAFAERDFDRMSLARTCWALLRSAAGDLAGGAQVNYLATLMGPQQMPDPADSARRVVMLTVDLMVRPAP